MREKTINQLQTLFSELIKLPECQWLEFKHNNEDPEMIGEDISALANSAALEGRSSAYFIWGVEDESRQPVGTKFKPKTKRYKQQELESWLLQKIEPKIDFRFFEFEYQGLPVVILEIQPAIHKPVRFDGTEFIRIGSYIVN